MDTELLAALLAQRKPSALKRLWSFIQFCFVLLLVGFIFMSGKINISDTRTQPVQVQSTQPVFPTSVVRYVNAQVQQSNVQPTQEVAYITAAQVRAYITYADQNSFLYNPDALACGGLAQCNGVKNSQLEEVAKQIEAGSIHLSTIDDLWRYAINVHEFKPPIVPTSMATAIGTEYFYDPSTLPTLEPTVAADIIDKCKDVHVGLCNMINQVQK